MVGKEEMSCHGKGGRGKGGDRMGERSHPCPEWEMKII